MRENSRQVLPQGFRVKGSGLVLYNETLLLARVIIIRGYGL